MYVRSGVPAGVEMTPEKLVARDPMPAGTPVARQVMSANNEIVERAEEELSKRGSGGAIDTVNLNVSGEGVTMTFVESETEDEQQ
ncbi:hypothetical protein CGLO_12866 [Colletotrichum gloeosporioides Cg-14]|uniref:Uncharacterized protein n=1 Tax=Colletotrichum gloeosporioides (strain Cg-14) TaxID=1237896 RepID=T0K7K6_COLGC|nr:hypothetical protein CGLO_12866 [Colletotrichum gloeosporioides Cg-14]